MKKTKKQKKRRIIYYQSYHHDENDRLAYLTEEQYNILKPHEYALRMGNRTPDNVNDLVWETLMERSKEVLKGTDCDADIIVAIC